MLKKILDTFEDSVSLGLFCLVVLFGVACLETGICVWLWNWIGVSYFGLMQTSFWPMFGLKLLIVFLMPQSSSKN